MLLLINGERPKDVFKDWEENPGDIPAGMPMTDDDPVADVTDDPANWGFWRRLGEFLLKAFAPIDGEHLDYM